MKNNTRLMDEYLELDKGERVPLSLTFKLLLNKDCRKQMKMLRFAEKANAEPLSISTCFTDSTIAAVMAKIDPEYAKKAEKNPISIAGWIIGGAVMIFFMIACSFFVETMDETTELICYLIFAATLVIYSALFVGTNLDFFIKKIEILKR